MTHFPITTISIMQKLFPYISSVMLVLGLSLGTAFAQPANDDLCDAVLLTVGAGCNGVTNGDNTSATAQTNEPVPTCFSGGANSVWFKFVGPASGFVDVSTNTGTVGTNDDTEIAVYSINGACDFANLTELACDQDINFTNYLSIIEELPVTPGDTFYVQVSGWNGTEGSFCLEVAEFFPPAAPANDDLCSAVALTVDAGCNGVPNGDNTGSTAQPGEPVGVCFSGGANSVWFKFEAPASGLVTISTDVAVGGTNEDTEIALYSANSGACSLDSLVEIACDQDGGSVVGFGFNSIIAGAAVTPGDTLYVQVSGWNGTEGTFCIEVASVVVPPNDDLCDAVALTVGDPCTAGDNTGSSLQTGEPEGSCFFPPNNSVWYSFVAPASGFVTISTDFDSAFVTNDDTEIALYTLNDPSCATVDSLVEVACDQDGGTVIPFASIIAVQAVTPGETYYVQVSGYNGTSGAFCIAVEEVFLPVSDNICDAVDLPVDGSVSTFYNTGAGVETLEDSLLAPPLGDGQGNFAWFENDITNSVWFTFTAPASGAVLIDLCNGGVGTDFDTQVAVYDADSCSNFGHFNVLAANDDIPGFLCGFASVLDVYCLTPGESYYIVVDGWGGDTGNFGISISEITNIPAITATATTTSPLCPGDATGSVTVTATGGAVNDYAPLYSYLWDTGDTTETVSGLTPGDYTVAVSDPCGDTASFTFTVPDVTGPALTANAGDDQGYCETGGSVVLGTAMTGMGGLAAESRRAYGSDLGGGGDFFRHKVRDLDDQENLSTGNGAFFAGDFAFGVFFVLDNANQELLTLDTISGAATILGASVPLAGHTWTGLAFDQTTSTMYAVSTNGSAAQLYTVDLGSGAATPTVVVTTPIPIWLAIDTAGMAYTLDILDDNLYSVDLTTGAATSIGPVGFNASFAQDADFDPETNILYLAAYNADISVAEYRSVNVSTGASTYIGDFNRVEVGAYGIAGEVIEPYTYTWSPALALDNPFSANPTSTTPVTTTYVVSVSDDCGLVATDTITIEVGTPPTLSLTSVAINDSTGVTGEATVDIQGGTPPYTIMWSNGATGATTTATDSGFVTVMVTDSLGCVVTDSIFVDDITSIDDLSSLGISTFKAFPNPSNGAFTLQVSLLKPERMEIAIYNMSGQRIFTDVSNGLSTYEQVINLSQAAAGVYMLSVTTAQGQAFKRLTIR